MRSISILGATGSVGDSTLKLLRQHRDAWRVEALTAQCSATKLAQLAREFDARIAVVGDESCLPELREALAGTGIEAAGGRAALIEAARVNLAPAILSAREGGDSHLSPLRRRRGVELRARLHGRDL